MKCYERIKTCFAQMRAMGCGRKRNHTIRTNPVTDENGRVEVLRVSNHESIEMELEGGTVLSLKVEVAHVWNLCVLRAHPIMSSNALAVLGSPKDTQTEQLSLLQNYGAEHCPTQKRAGILCREIPQCQLQ